MELIYAVIMFGFPLVIGCVMFYKILFKESPLIKKYKLK